MKVFVLGATGFIGLPAAQALVRAGHSVYGLARTPEKAKQLAAEEIIPVLGDSNDPSKWEHIIADVDVVLEAVASNTELEKLSRTVQKAVADAAVKLRPPHAPKLTYIYTSGTWVHGEDRENIVSDTTPLTKPATLVAWRPQLEQDVLANPAWNPVIVRPALLYGRGGSLVAPLFDSALQGKAIWYGTPGARMAFIHCDDLAQLYVLIAEKAQLVGGKIFDAANDITEGTEDVLARVAKVSGAKSWELKKPSNLYEEALSTTTILRPYLARALLGWQPRKAGFADNIEVYLNAWRANVGK
ncbi:hypothetical protein EIP91_001161 [Steccherinum ochraceum]|uniref:NAD-dependent epimerase/dehydratase domain-containing protein n=1 Tax=Steccherinum ochraceum TaxID=92696 RepID=A0A4R0RTT7_9APHY|nr:hypothetical protein EIP91_001161 [Steccherinum ochraceum]